MHVSQHDVDELRRDVQALRRDDAVADITLQTIAEALGFAIYKARALGMDEAEVLEAIELQVRAADLDRESIREARGVLAALHYGTAITKLLTRLAAKAKPATPSFRARWQRQSTRCRRSGRTCYKPFNERC